MVEADFRAVQRAFTAHLRQPQRAPAPADVEPRRVALYRDLLYRNVEGTMANAFPVLRRLLDDTAWHALVGEYFAEHRARTPLFPRMPLEFLRFLESRGPRAGEPPFVHELAHWEWLEAEVLFDPRELDLAGLDPEPDFLHRAVVLNPLLRTRAYRFPVHRLRPEFQPAEPAAAPVCLAICRRRDDGVSFMEMNAVSARLLDLVTLAPQRPAAEHYGVIAAELAHPAPERLAVAAAALLADFHARELVLGTRAPA